mmetsp:Transcript_45393/g.80604  ORF Transcript_45393/g.80604 Transcript_45393/m.80604 type:complete len:495 (+) Transcript_45393:24-1508(+)
MTLAPPPGEYIDEHHRRLCTPKHLPTSPYGSFLGGFGPSLAETLNPNSATNRVLLSPNASTRRSSGEWMRSSRSMGATSSTASAATLTNVPRGGFAADRSAPLSNFTRGSLISPKLEVLKGGMLRKASEPIMRTAPQMIHPVKHKLVEAESACEDHATSMHSRSVTGYHDIESATACIDKSLSWDPRHSPSWRHLSEIKLYKQDYSGVIHDATEAIRLEKTHAPSWGRRGHAKYAQGDFQGAIADCSEAIRHNPLDTHAWGTRGHARLAQLDYHGALEDCSRAIRMDNRGAENWSACAAAKVVEQDWDSAVECASEAIKLNSRYLDGWLHRATARNGRGDHEGAIADCAKVMLRDHYCIDALTQSAYAKVMMKDFEGAMVDADRALYMDKTNAELWTSRAQAKFGMGDMKGALEDVNEAIRDNPDCTRAWWFRGKVLLVLGKYADAYEDGRTALSLPPHQQDQDNSDARNIVEVAQRHMHTVQAWKLPALARDH